MLRGLGRKMGRMLWIEVCVVDFFVFLIMLYFLDLVRKNGDWKGVSPGSRLESGVYLKYLSAQNVRLKLL